MCSREDLLLDLIGVGEAELALTAGYLKINYSSGRGRARRAGGAGGFFLFSPGLISSGRGMRYKGQRVLNCKLVTGLGDVSIRVYRLSAILKGESKEHHDYVEDVFKDM